MVAKPSNISNCLLLWFNMAWFNMAWLNNYLANCAWIYVDRQEDYFVFCTFSRLNDFAFR